MLSGEKKKRLKMINLLVDVNHLLKITENYPQLVLLWVNSQAYNGKSALSVINAISQKDDVEIEIIANENIEKDFYDELNDAHLLA